MNDHDDGENWQVDPQGAVGTQNAQSPGPAIETARSGHASSSPRQIRSSQNVWSLAIPSASEAAGLERISRKSYASGLGSSVGMCQSVTWPESSPQTTWEPSGVNATAVQTPANRAMRSPNSPVA